AELGTFVGPYVIAEGTSLTGTMIVPIGYVVDISSGTQAILTKTGGSETYAAWLATKFSAGELLNPVISGPQADPDGDGMGNLLEFVVGTEPKTPEQGKGPAYTTPSGIPTITLAAKTTSLSQVTVTGESGIDLINWPDAMTLTSSTPETPIAGYTTLIFTGTVAGEKRFYRLEIVSPTP
ncbi:MAG: hypothetical protein H8M99_13905, partial [Gloeobacteraceae cyanobacterium ES-bin-144]|nr:hypothetical protein [Verrucomicrobiales bacterium]